MIDPFDYQAVWASFVASVLIAAILAMGVVGCAYACGFFGKEP